MMLEGVRGFLDFLQHEKGFSVNTLAAYQNDLNQFIEFVQKQPRPELETLGWAGVDQPMISDFVLSLKERNYAPATVARKIAAVRSFYHYLLQRQEIQIDPTENLDSPKVGKPEPKSLTPEEISRLLEQPRKLSTPEAKRDSAMLELLYATGMRVTELVSLDVDHVDLLAGTVHCGGRGKRERVLPIGPQVIKAIGDYLKHARPKLLRDRSTDALFLNHRGDRLTRQGFWLILKSHGKAANITKSLAPHVIRHSFAVKQVENDVPLPVLREMLGHVNLSTTQVYAKHVNKRESQKERTPIRQG